MRKAVYYTLATFLLLFCLHSKSFTQANCGWQQGDMKTYTQDDWGAWTSEAGALLDANFRPLFSITFVVGEFATLTLTSSVSVFDLLPTTGPAGSLFGDMQDPISTPAGDLAGEVVALKLNVEFSDANLLPSLVPLGDLVFHDFTDLPVLNGQTIREFLSTANYLLGGGMNAPFSHSVAAAVARRINNAFVNGIPSQFAQEQLKLPCQTVPVNHPPTATSTSAATPVGASITIQLQASDEDNDNLTYTISQQPAHGTISVSANGLATYTPVKGYSGADQFTFQVSDGTYYAEAIVEVSVFNCPRGQGYWKMHADAWPPNTSSMVLGAASYTKTQLLSMLDAPKSGDASLILAAQLIAAKLNQADGIPTTIFAATIIHADALLASFPGKLPYKVKTNTTAGKTMTADAAALEGFNLGAQTPGCQTSQTATSITQKQSAPTVVEEGFSLDQNQPNPFTQNTTIRYHLPGTYHVTLKVYDGLGRELQTLVNEVQQAGTRSVQFDAVNRSTGVYYYKLTAGPFAAVRKMVLTK